MKGHSSLIERLDKIGDLISESDSIVVSGHRSPDQDSFASSVALYLFLLCNFPSKEIKVLLDDEKEIPGYIRELYEGYEFGVVYANDGESLEALEEGVDLFVGVDCFGRERLDDRFLKVFDNSREKAFIDHHKSIDDNYLVASNSGMPSCSCLIYSFLSNFSNTINLDDTELKGILYRAFYIGLLGDTGNFLNLNTDRDTMRMAGEFSRYMDKEPYQIAQEMYYNLNQEDLEALSYITSNINNEFDGRLVYLDASELEDKFLAETMLKRIHPVDFLKRMESSELVFSAIKDSDGKVRVSLRSLGDKNILDVAEKLGGGGHEKAAGCTLEDRKDLEELLKLVRLKF